MGWRLRSSRTSSSAGGWIWIRSAGEITYGLERIAGFLQDVDSIYDIVWAVEPDTGREVTYGEMRLAEEEQFSAYSFDYADVASLWKHLELYEAECLALLEQAKDFESDGWFDVEAVSGAGGV